MSKDKPLPSDVVRRLVVNGLTMAVETHGDGVPVLFIHGFPLDRTVWRQIVSSLTGYQRIAPDLRGFGLSHPPEDGQSIGDYADDLVALLDLLGVHRAVVCGHSMGGYIAFELVRRFPMRVGGLILMNTRADADGPEARVRREELVRQVQERGTHSLVDAMLPKLLSPDGLAGMPGVVSAVRAMISAASPAGVTSALRAMKERGDSTPSLSDIGVPTLVVAGRDDQLVSLEQSQAMAERIRGAQLKVIPGAGHLVPMEQPVATTRVVAEFLESLT